MVLELRERIVRDRAALAEAEGEWRSAADALAASLADVRAAQMLADDMDDRTATTARRDEERRMDDMRMVYAARGAEGGV